MTLPLKGSNIKLPKGENIMGMTLKAARINKGLTQKEAAEKIGISVFTLGNYERGKSYPDVPVIKSIESVYDVSYQDIIFCP